jgi:GGDEF domain-containing protein
MVTRLTPGADALAIDSHWAAIASADNPDVLAVLAPDFTLLWVSASVERIYGYRPADLIGRSAIDLDVSIGRAHWRPGDSPEDLLHRADAAMYEQKENRK